MTDVPNRPADVFSDLPATGRVLVIVPTYDERDNLPGIVDRVRGSVGGADILVVDDGSPDGTGDVADGIAAHDGSVSVLHRDVKEGLGAAYRAGFGWGLERDYNVLVEMDADGSHAPEQLPRLLRGLAHADLVIGSRYVAGGSVVNWPAHRLLLSRGANLYARLALGCRVKDLTAGYRAYRADVLRTIDLDDVASQGYCFQVDLSWRTILAGYRVAEVPVTFTEREVGESKMNGSIMQEAFINIARWGLAHRVQQALDLRPRR